MIFRIVCRFVSFMTKFIDYQNFGAFLEFTAYLQIISSYTGVPRMIYGTPRGPRFGKTIVIMSITTVNDSPEHVNAY